MKGINKKGFTLIELLAVIVVLAIVMVLAATTVLPYMANARKEAFALEANTARKAASQAVSLITIGNVTDTTKYTKTETGYCFTIQDLRNLKLLTKDDTSYQGVVVVTKSDNGYSYKVELQNKEFFVKQTTAGDVVAGDLEDRTANVDVTVACS